MPRRTPDEWMRRQEMGRANRQRLAQHDAQVRLRRDRAQLRQATIGVLILVALAGCYLVARAAL